MAQETAMNNQETRLETFTLPSSEESALNSYCYVCGASSGQPCKVTRTGRLLSKPHASRRPYRVVNRFVSPNSNRLTDEAIAIECSVRLRGSNPLPYREPIGEVRDLKNDPTWQLAGRIAERVYVELGCQSVPVLQRAIDKALLEEKRANRSPTFNNRTLNGGKD